MQRLSRKTETLLQSRGVPRTVKKEEPVPASRTIRAAYAPMSRDSASGAPQSGQIALARVSGLGERRLLPSGALGPTSGLRVVTPALLSDDCQKPSRLPVHWRIGRIGRVTSTHFDSPLDSHERVLGRSQASRPKPLSCGKPSIERCVPFFPLKPAAMGRAIKNA